MISFKEEIAKIIANITKINLENIMSYIEVPPDENMGDYAFPCFKLAKDLKKSPQIIAEYLKNNIQINNSLLEKIEVVGGYLNFYINKKTLIKVTLGELDNLKENYGKSNIGNGKKILVEYSSPNIAKPFHIGHLRNTLIGHGLYNMYKILGYDVVGINHLGDYGTQFGKMIQGYKLWGNEYDLEKSPIEKLTQIYIRINDLCKKDESVLEECRKNFKKLEDGDKYCVDLWNRFKELSLKEFYKIYNLLGIEFDSLNGEAFYSDKMDEVENILEKSGKLVKSEGAKIVDLEEKKLGICMIKKSNDSTTYATRDLAAILYRARTYNFDKCLYVVAYEQDLHFKQVFETAKLLGIDNKYINGLIHISYGMVRLKTGKMSTREGTTVNVDELINEAISRVENIIEEKNPTMKNKKENARKIGIGAIIFSNIGTTIAKDQIFDWDTVLNFNGETGPYIQYTYVRTRSVLNSVENVPSLNEIDINELNFPEMLKIIKLIYNFHDILIQATEKNDTSILARYIIDLAKAYSYFYNEYKIISDNESEKNARVYLTNITGNILKIGMSILGIEMPDKM